MKTFPILCGLLAKKPTRLSQAMHSAAFLALEKLGGESGVYVAFDTEDTESAFNAMRALGIRGYSLTIPHKEKAFSLVDELDLSAKEIGAINTAILDDDWIKGYNTDWLGIKKAFDEQGVTLNKKSVLILGAGGASRAAIYLAKKEGAQVFIWARDHAKAKALALDFAVEAIENVEVELYDIVINSTPIGSHLASDSKFPFDLNSITAKQTFFDMVTKEETELLKAAKSKGAKTISGLRMLLFQAVEQFRLFSKQDKEFVDEMWEALIDETLRLGVK